MGRRGGQRAGIQGAAPPQPSRSELVAAPPQVLGVGVVEDADPVRELGQVEVAAEVHLQQHRSLSVSATSQDWVRMNVPRPPSSPLTGRPPYATSGCCSFAVQEAMMTLTCAPLRRWPA